jgi:hypothetical protein
MTMLTYARDPFERTRFSSANNGLVGGGNAAAHLATIKRFCMGVVTILAAGAAVTAVMALKLASYLPHIVHY